MLLWIFFIYFLKCILHKFSAYSWFFLFLFTFLFIFKYLFHNSSLQCWIMNLVFCHFHLPLEYWMSFFHTFDLDFLEAKKKCTSLHPSHFFYDTMLLLLCSSIVKYDVFNCYAGDRGTAWHAHCWSCNFIFVPSHLHSSCPPWSTWLCRSSFGMFHFKLFALCIFMLTFWFIQLSLPECSHWHCFIFISLLMDGDKPILPFNQRHSFGRILCIWK